MGKHETPILRMVVQGDRLVPTAAWEAERLSTYRTGSIVNVIITQEKNRKLERKYWAILNRVVRDCPVKWRTAEDAHKAIRLSLGVVEPFITTGGKMHAEVKSTADMDDPEYQRYYEDAMALLHRITGVNPETLHLEAADVGHDEQDPASDALPDAAGSVDHASPGDPAADHSAIDAPPGEKIRSTEDATMDAGPATGESSVGSASPLPGEEPGPEAGAIEAPDGQVAAPASADLSEADRDWLKLVGKLLWAATGMGEQQVLKNQFEGAKANYTPDTISRAARDRGNSIYQKCKLVCFGEADSADTLVQIAMVACCEPKELVA